MCFSVCVCVCVSMEVYLTIVCLCVCAMCVRKCVCVWATGRLIIHSTYVRRLQKLLSTTSHHTSSHFSHATADKTHISRSSSFHTPSQNRTRRPSACAPACFLAATRTQEVCRSGASFVHGRILGLAVDNVLGGAEGSHPVVHWEVRGGAYTRG